MRQLEKTRDDDASESTKSRPIRGQRLKTNAGPWAIMHDMHKTNEMHVWGAACSVHRRNIGEGRGKKTGLRFFEIYPVRCLERREALDLRKGQWIGLEGDGQALNEDLLKESENVPPVHKLRAPCIGLAQVICVLWRQTETTLSVSSVLTLLRSYPNLKFQKTVLTELHKTRWDWMFFSAGCNPTQSKNRCCGQRRNGLGRGGQHTAIFGVFRIPAFAEMILEPFLKSVKEASMRAISTPKKSFLTESTGLDVLCHGTKEESGAKSRGSKPAQLRMASSGRLE